MTKASSPSKTTERGTQEAVNATTGAPEVTAGLVLRELKSIAFANMADVLRIEPDGLPNVDLSKLTRENAVGIQHIELEIREIAEPGATKYQVIKARVKLADKICALKLLGMHLGLFKEKIEMENPARTLFEQFCGKSFRPIQTPPAQTR